jgi:hypothetical protein
MRRLLLIGLVLVVGGWWHRVPLNGAPPAVASYTGPGDIVSGATAFYGLRAYTAAIAAAGTQKLINLRRASDNETCDILVATNGGLGLTTACSGADGGKSVATFLTATTGFVTKAYDQSGNAHDVSQATSALQPQLLLTGCTSGSLPCMKFVAASTQVLAGTTGAVTQPWTYSVVANYNSGSCTPNTCELISNYAGAGAIFEFQPTIVYMYSGGAAADFVSAAATTWHSVQAVFNDAGTSSINADGTTVSGAVGTGGGATTVNIGNLPSSTHYLDGDLVEAGLWPSAFSGGNVSAMNSNQHSYWGF